jgi:hypothetical protein
MPRTTPFCSAFTVDRRGSPAPWLWAAGLRAHRHRHRQGDGERGAVAVAFAFGDDVAVVQLDDVAGDGEAEAAALVRAFRLAQAVEDVRKAGSMPSPSSCTRIRT